MAKPNRQFDLTVSDMDLIETALRSRKASLSKRLIEMKETNEELRESLYQIHDLLGRLHNQKSFYRPQQGVYIGG